MIWFDLYDTLVDFGRASEIALRTIYASRRLDRFFPDEQRWLDIYHRHNAALWDRFNRGEVTGDFLRPERFRLTLAEQCGPDGFPADLPMLLSEGYLHHLAENASPMPGAPEALRAVRAAGLRTGVLTNGFSGVQERKLQVAGLDALVDEIVISDRVGANKPSAAIFEAAARQARSHANAMVGDNPDTDIAGAAGAGWAAVLFDPRGRWTATSWPRASSLETAARMAISALNMG